MKVENEEEIEMTPLEKAQDIAWDAFDAYTKYDQITLAKKALEISEDCADAYNVLAWNANSFEKALELYKKALETAERVLDSDFDKLKGCFWGAIKTRPYMRAKKGIVDCLYELGDIDGAIQHCQEMLELNPGDNQGIRCTLCLYLYRAKRDKELEELFEKYADGTLMGPLIDWQCHHALWLFRSQKYKEATHSLLRIFKANPHIHLYLLGKKKIPAKKFDYLKLGHESEACEYAREGKIDWQTTPNALAWLRKMAGFQLLETNQTNT